MNQPYDETVPARLNAILGRDPDAPVVRTWRGAPFLSRDDRIEAIKGLMGATFDETTAARLNAALGRHPTHRSSAPGGMPRSFRLTTASKRSGH